MAKRKKKGRVVVVNPATEVVVEKDSRLGSISLGAFGLLVFVLGILLPTLIMRLDGIISGLIR